MDEVLQETSSKKTSSVNQKGELDHSISLSSLSWAKYGRIRVESSVQDERGKYIASSSSVKFHGVDRFVGLKNTKWDL